MIKKILLFMVLIITISDNLFTLVNANESINVVAEIPASITLVIGNNTFSYEVNTDKTLKDLLVDLKILDSTEGVFFDSNFTHQVDLKTLLSENSIFYIKLKKSTSTNVIPENNSIDTKDDELIYTTDSCGNVYDRWGNLIFKGECQYELVNTIDDLHDDDKTILLTANMQSTYTVKLPKTIFLNQNITIYDFSVTGNIKADEVLKIYPQESFVISSKNHEEVICYVEHEYNEFLQKDLFNKEIAVRGKITHEPLDPGNWKGSYSVQISLQKVGE